MTVKEGLNRRLSMQKENAKELKDKDKEEELKVKIKANKKTSAFKHIEASIKKEKDKKKARKINSLLPNPCKKKYMTIIKKLSKSDLFLMQAKKLKEQEVVIEQGKALAANAGLPYEGPELEDFDELFDSFGSFQ